MHFLVPVPLATRRLRERGYNQSLEIARHVARATGTRLAHELCERARDTAAPAGKLPPRAMCDWTYGRLSSLPQSPAQESIGRLDRSTVHPFANRSHDEKLD